MKNKKDINEHRSHVVYIHRVRLWRAVLDAYIVINNFKVSDKGVHRVWDYLDFRYHKHPIFHAAEGSEVNKRLPIKLWLEHVYRDLDNYTDKQLFNTMNVIEQVDHDLRTYLS